MLPGGPKSEGMSSDGKTLMSRGALIIRTHTSEPGSPDFKLVCYR